jgi:hypothetical protein
MIYELSYSMPITGICIKALEASGELEYYSSFTKPFYRLVIGDDIQLKGVEESSTARLILFRGCIDAFIEQLNVLFE